jgi:hypothetical protein
MSQRVAQKRGPMTSSAKSGLLSAAMPPRMSLTLMRAMATRRIHFHDVKQPISFPRRSGSYYFNGG